MKAIKNTKRSINAIKLPETGRVEYKTDRYSWLRVRVSFTGKITFSVFKSVKGKSKRIQIGDYPAFSPEEAESRGLEIIRKLQTGEFERDKAKERKDALTVGEVLEMALEAKTLSDRTVRDYRECMDDLGWNEISLVEITPKKAITRHKEISKRSQVRANKAFRVLSSLWSFAEAVLATEDGISGLPNNPVKVFTTLNVWNKENRRQRLIKAHQLKAWFEAVMALETEPQYQNPTRTGHKFHLAPVCSFLFRVYLLTGMRRTTVEKLTWEQYDKKSGTLEFWSKGRQEAFNVPVCDYLREELDLRWKRQSSRYIFPNASGDSSISSNSVNNWLDEVRRRSMIKFSPHDLRRTFLTIADGLPVSDRMVKRLVDHSTDAGKNSDITSGYVVSSIEALRDTANKVSKEILTEAKLR